MKIPLWPLWFLIIILLLSGCAGNLSQLRREYCPGYTKFFTYQYNVCREGRGLAYNCARYARTKTDWACGQVIQLANRKD